MISKDRSLMAHLLRRTGFGANPDELESYLDKGYERTVEEILHPSAPGNMPDDLIRRYHVEQSELRDLAGSAAYWMYRMISTSCPMEEKIALFWHGLFATGYAKLNQARSLLNQVDMFRKKGLGNYETLLLELSQDPAMIVWLDNNENHSDAINENYGRELLELFSMGIGNYSEDDIKECARAFTGWSLGNPEYMAVRASKDSIWPYGRIAWHFKYMEEDHDDGIKTFLGETGRFNGEDIIDIIVRHPATAKFVETGNFNGEDIISIIVKQESTANFIATRLFQFFGSDEVTDEGNEVIQDMVDTYFSSGYEIRDMLRTLFHSEFFKSDNAMFSRVKNPVEMVVGAVRMAGNYQAPVLGIEQVSNTMLLVERINFAAKELSNVNSPGIRSIIERLEVISGEGTLTPSDLTDQCLDLLGPIKVSDETRNVLVQYAEIHGDLDLRGHQPGDQSEEQVGNMLRLVASTKEYQLA